MPDRPDNSPEEIEITPAMIEAGFWVLFNYGITEDVRQAARDVYRAMVAASSHPSEVRSENV